MTKRKHIPIVEPDMPVRTIPGFEGRYAVTECGRIWSFAKTMGKSRHGGRWLRAALSHGYPTVALFIGQRQCMCRVHRAVALAWVPNASPETFTDVNHLNGDRADCRASNLEWCDRAHNNRHAVETGLRTYRRLPPAYQERARAMRASGAVLRQIAAALSVSVTTAHNLLKTPRDQSTTIPKG